MIGVVMLVHEGRRLWRSRTGSICAFVATNSLCQGHQVPLLWPLIFRLGYKIFFAHTSFKWENLASNNAGVTVAIIGLSRAQTNTCKLFSVSDEGVLLSREVFHINAYLVGGVDVIVEKRSSPLSELSPLDLGNMPYDGGNLLLYRRDVDPLNLTDFQRQRLVRRIYGSKGEFIGGLERYCLWIEDRQFAEAVQVPQIRERIEAVRNHALSTAG